MLHVRKITLLFIVLFIFYIFYKFIELSFISNKHIFYEIIIKLYKKKLFFFFTTYIIVN